ncbi:MAG: prephenate dehydrogenase/arogenate dehydrogenase family protein [Ruminococcaceae bacterium]|nr:prephenate dehydrogenase/arogenate dehydrogenase family protein [Oscillospiraceae bacterium]
MKIGIVGLGLIGGSLAKCIKRYTDNQVLGIDINEESMTMAHMSGAIDGELTAENMSDCRLIMIAIPPVALVKWVEDNAKNMKGTLLIDMCGVKRSICDKLHAVAAENGFSYLGGHPMAGREVSGFANATVDLFKGASMILTPDERTDILMLDLAKHLFMAIGFDSITFTTPDEHDRIIAYTSQLAHITSSAYIKSPTAQKHMGFSAGSYRDLTRVAKLDEKLWTELFLENSDYLTGELRQLVDNLNEYLTALEAKDADKLVRLLRDGRELKLTAGGD